MITKRLARNRRSQRGLALVWTTASLTVVIVISSLAIDMGWLYFRRQHVQAAADAAALAGDWALAQGYSDTNANAVATKVLTAEGYTNDGTTTYPSITLTPHSNSTANNYSVTVNSNEPMFFAGMTRNTHQVITGQATANFVSYATIWFDPSTYGTLNGPFALCSYGPDQGATRGDAVDSRWKDIAGGVTKVANPLNWDAANNTFADKGQSFVIQPVTNWSTINPDRALTNGNKLMVQIFDPETYVPLVSGAVDPNAMDQYVDVNGSGHTSAQSAVNEAWQYTLYTQNNTTMVQTQLATATYSESSSQQNLYRKWVTPPGFSVDISTYDLTNTSFIVNVKTANAYVAGSSNAIDKNGYLIRAGPDYTNDTALNSTLSTDGSGNQIDSSTSTAWNTKFGNVSGTGSLAATGAQNNLCITAYGTGTGDISFGSLSANPNTTQPSIITFNGWDEDSGATSISYNVVKSGQSYNNTTFTGSLTGSGNGLWSDPGSQIRGVSAAGTASNTVYFAPGAYQGGTWKATYQTGSQDVSTWNWTVNWSSNGGYFKPRLVYTNNSQW